MHQVLKEEDAIVLEKEDQVETSLVVTQAAAAPMRVNGMELRKTSLEELVRELRETLTVGMGLLAYQA